MKPDRTMIDLPLDLALRCDVYGRDLAAHYRVGGSPQSRAYSSHGAEANPILLCDSKVGECVFALHMNLDPLSIIKWDVGHPDPAFDLMIGPTRVDVKQTYLHYRFLIWPIRKNSIFDSKQFDVLALVKTEVIRDDSGAVVRAKGYAEGWSGKRWFRSRRRVAPDGLGNKLTPETRYLEEHLLHRMGVFPGYSDDEREHYCWCGEFGSHGFGVSTINGKLGTWYCFEHRPISAPAPSYGPPAAFEITERSRYDLLEIKPINQVT